MGTLVAFLAVAGVAALVFRAGRSTLRLALHAAEVTATAGLVEISARRGDLTGLSERRDQEAAARRLRRRELVRTLAWLLWLALPAALPWSQAGYALAAPLWLIPMRRREARKP